MALHRDGRPETVRGELRLLRCGLRSLQECEGLRAPEAQRLVSLQLHGNCLSTLRGLDAACPLLEQLIISSNDLQSLDGLQGLQRLRILDVSSNCLSGFHGLHSPILEELRAAYNQISGLGGLQHLRGPQSRLRLLDLRDNAVAHLGELLYLGGLPLEDLRLQSPGGRRGNPICRLPGYRSAALCACPDLQLLDEELAEREGVVPLAVLPDWPVQPQPQATPKAAPCEPDASMAQELRLWRDERKAAAEASANFRAMLQQAEARMANQSSPKISQHMQHELRLVASEAKRRQAMTRELKAKLSESSSELQAAKASQRLCHVEALAAKSRAHGSQRRRAEAALEEETCAALCATLGRHGEEAAAELWEANLQADALLAGLQEETQALAEARGQLSSQRAMQRKLQALRPEDRLAQEDQSQARCRAEAAACAAAQESAEDARRLLAADLQAEASELQRVEEACVGSRQQTSRLAQDLRHTRDSLREELQGAEKRLQELERQRELQGKDQELQRVAAETTFRQRHRQLLEEGRALQAEIHADRKLLASKEQLLHRHAQCVQDSQLQAGTLEEALDASRAQELVAQEQMAAANAAFQSAAHQLALAQVRHRKEREQHAVEEALLRSDFVPMQLLQEEQQRLAAVRREHLELRTRLSDTEAEERFAAESLSQAEEPQRLQKQLVDLEDWAAKTAADFQRADQKMDAVQRETQTLQEKVRLQQELRSKRTADWQRADAEVEARVQDAWAEEEAAQDLEEALQEEKHQLQKEAEQFDADLLWLESSVDEATQAWREAPSAQMMLEAQEAESMRQAQEAEAHLASLGRALAKELQKHREANRSLQGAVESEERELEGYIREEKVEQ
ncbi:unnamed protein product, partial [Effrenium voratum]